ncbi:HAD-IIA family hydrolase [Zhihengliuella salsuginis]|uniref:Sugar-phosphatase n=1 Tax=Zhihengliuella salsuginis TaxID=578222 RepID=A0ABQ3GJB8_9MICC|nr:HAD-IIA family hydrolase [Zhihengliuella salsuginis]GHD08974.1 sugar-phosphatase [Zhihengliuella salsuginis]
MLIGDYDAVLSDLDGVVYAGAGAIEGAVEALSALAGHRKALGYITNNASRSPSAVAEHLRELGAPATAETVFGSADAGAELLAGHVDAGAAILVTGSDYLRECVTRLGYRVVASHTEEPAAVVQGFHPDLGWADLAEAAFAISRGAFWVATNTDMTIPRAEGIAPGNGSLVQAVGNATGTDPIVAGKPEAHLFEKAAHELGAGRPLVVGDRLDTDILGGNRAGFATAAVLTGIDTTASIIAADPRERPDFILEGLAQLYVSYPTVDVAEDADVVRATCGSDSARAEAHTVVLSSDRLDAWRAACAAWWTRNPRSAREPRIEFED